MSPNMLTFGQDLHFDQIMTEDVKSWMSGGTQRSVRNKDYGATAGKDAAEPPLLLHPVLMVGTDARPHVVLSLCLFLTGHKLRAI